MRTAFTGLTSSAEPRIWGHAINPAALPASQLPVGHAFTVRLDPESRPEVVRWTAGPAGREAVADGADPGGGPGRDVVEHATAISPVRI
ncbi:hypothetical protein GA0074696_4825 [Micromonospora purpureochromogenes]|uniref:Uncharacterized protein n=1 Tax=Micromonospora purpureochromogenes TaxID=47872 RepID=A0A1C4ZSV3_9ACTN|nr:hypothetical protein GA0074696_4825 [Micromonospora purpureochromogenes]